MKAVAKEIVTRLVGYSDDEAFEVVKLEKVSNDGLWTIYVKEPKRIDETTEDSESEITE